MHLMQIFLPVTDNQGNQFPQSLFNGVKDELAEKFGGVTAFTQSPAEGLWIKDHQTQKDRILIYEVMTETMEHAWWSHFRKRMETLLKQERILIRSMVINLI